MMQYIRRYLAASILICCVGALAGADAIVLAPTDITGTTAHPGDPDLPGARPTGAILGRSRAEGSVQVLDVRCGISAGNQLAVMIHPGSKPRDMRLIAVDKAAKRKEIGRASLNPNGWQVLKGTLPAECEVDFIQVAGVGTEAFWITGGCVRATGDIQLSDLAVLPNPLLPLGYDGSQGVPQIARVLAGAPLPGTTLRVLMPGSGTPDEKVVGDRLVEAIAKGWNVLPPPNPPKPIFGRDVTVELPKPVTVGADSLRWYASPTALGSSIEACLAELPQLLVINLSGTRSPTGKPDAMAKLLTQASRAGVTVAIIVDERPDDTKVRRDWQQWLGFVRQAAPALGIIDQQSVREWYDQPGAVIDTANALLGDAIDHAASTAIGFTDLRARYSWALYEGRVELAPPDPNSPAGRRRNRLNGP